VTDDELVRAFQRGEREAFDELVRRWERPIRGAAFRLVGSEDEARDVTQEAFLKAYRSLGGFKGEAKFSSWLYQIALNLCRDRMRRRKGRTFVSLEGEATAHEDGRAAGPTALELVVARDTARAVSAAVAELPDEQREVVILKEYEGLTFAEVAEVLGVPSSTVKTRMYRALTTLRSRLLERGVVPAAATPAPTAWES
jgi:RNA polymerase sigma-70 factor (ECF subfamily)